MTFQDAIRNNFQKYIEINGRAPRSEFWWWVLFIFAGNLVFSMLGIDILGLVFGLGTLLPSIAVGVRRLHDRDMSGWWMLLGLIPAIGGLIILVICAFEGTQGPNRFGPDPLGRAAATPPPAPEVDRTS